MFSNCMLNIYIYALLYSGVDIASVPDEQILNGNQPDLDECENQDEDAVAMVEEPNSGI